ncbi:MAG: APC family permease [Anaerolineae bacterium]|nr:APC family permease [Anaerolineae bacterium]MCB0246224.1 APC family permease [Anaerolineae bacterium]
MEVTRIKRALIGKPFPTSHESHERLDKIRGLAVFASDPISSNAYATEAIMAVLIVMGSGALWITLPLAIGVAALVLLVIFSYIQTILHYPTGGGSYIVAMDNLGRWPALVAGAALLTDYILTVSVSSAAGVRAITSAIPALKEYSVLLAIGAILFIAWINLRGMRESGSVFAIPTYAFVAGVLLVILIGLVRYLGLFGASPLPVESVVVEPLHPVTGAALLWLLLRAFAGGCTALTGIEAISDGVPAFKRPESINAAKTMIVMGIIAMSLFLGITFLATHMSLVPSEHQSLLSLMTREITGDGLIYIWVQLFTALILLLAANTGFQDFPRLSSFLARDGFMPRWMQSRGDRLVFSSGIVMLTALSIGMIIIFRANEIKMLPLYALGVMLAFTLSQSGMFKLFGKIATLKPDEIVKTSFTQIHGETGTSWKRAVSLVGATVTGIVFVILVATKFVEGAWAVALIIPLLVIVFDQISKHYDRVAEALSTRGLSDKDLITLANVVLVPIADVHKGTIQALQYASRLSSDVRAVCIVTSPEMHERLLRRWNRFPELTANLQLVMIDYDFRDILEPLVEYIERVNTEEFPHQKITIVIPEFIATSAMARVLHNQTAGLLRKRLRNQEDLVIIDVPYHIREDDEPGADE